MFKKEKTTKLFFFSLILIFIISISTTANPIDDSINSIKENIFSFFSTFNSQGLIVGNIVIKQTTSSNIITLQREEIFNPKKVSIIIPKDNPNMEEDYIKENEKNEVFNFPIITPKKGYSLPHFNILTPSQTGQFGISGTGVVTSIDYSRQNNNKILMGTGGAGLFLSDDAGNNWNQLNSFPYNLIDKVAIDPENDQHFFAVSFGNLLFETKDNGRSWKLNTNLNNETGCYNIPGAGGGVDIIYYNKTNIFYRCDKEIIISNNNGQTWNKNLLPITISNYAVSFAKIKDNGIGLIAINDQSTANLFITLDGGLSWKTILNSSNLNNHQIMSYDISEDGYYIVVALNMVGTTISPALAKSTNRGQTWNFININSTIFYNPDNTFNYIETRKPFGASAQDLIINSSDKNKIIAFAYNYGLLTSNDGGINFILNYTPTNLVYLPIAKQINYFGGPTITNNAFLITPVDLRPSNLIIDKNKIYLPTDQGLFLFNIDNNNLKNIAPQLNLAATERVRVTSCSRVYSGLWHVGQFWVNPDNSIEGLSDTESAGSSIGNDIGCSSEAMSAAGYLLNGTIILRNSYPQEVYFAVSQEDSGFNKGLSDVFFRNSQANYYNGWYYFVGIDNKLYRTRLPGDNSIKLELIKLPDAITEVYAFYYKNGIYYILDASSSPYLWYSSNLLDWSPLLNSLSAYSLGNSQDYINGHYFNYAYSALGNGFLFINESQQIIIGGIGLFITNNNGSTWYSNFSHTITSNVIKDNCGFLYVGLQPYSKIKDATQLQLSGIFISKDSGLIWQPFGSGNLQKSSISYLWLSNDN